jgi:hypothetical protein
MRFNIYGAFYSQFSQLLVSAGILAFFRVMPLLQEYKMYQFDCVTVTP